VEADKSVDDPNSHIINIGQLVEVVISVILLFRMLDTVQCHIV